MPIDNVFEYNGYLYPIKVATKRTTVGDVDLIDAVSGKSLLVLGLDASGSVNTSILLKDGAGTVMLGGGGRTITTGAPWRLRGPAPWGKTALGSKVVANSSAIGSVDWTVQYCEVD